MITINNDKEALVVFHELLPNNAMLIPMGYYYNREFRDLKIGDRLKFWDGKYGVFVRSCVLDMRTPIFATLVKYLYGEYASVGRVMERWVAHAIVNGNSEDVISKTHCLFVQYLPIEKKKRDAKKDKKVVNKRVGRKSKKPSSKVQRKGGDPG